MRAISAFSIIAALLLAACDKSSEPRYDGAESVCPIAALQSLCDHSDSHAITQDAVIEGRVIGNDRFGEFHKTLVIEDSSGGIQIAVDGERLADRFPFGATLRIHCNGLTLCDYGGKITLGTTPTEYGAGRIPADGISRYIRTADPEPQAPEPLRLDISGITARHTDCYIRLDGVSFTAGGNWCETDHATGKKTTTEHTVVDANGNTLTVRVPPTVEYANEPLPEGKGSLCGVADLFAGRYSLRITNREWFFDGN